MGKNVKILQVGAKPIKTLVTGIDLTDLSIASTSLCAELRGIDDFRKFSRYGVDYLWTRRVSAAQFLPRKSVR